MKKFSITIDSLKLPKNISTTTLSKKVPTLLINAVFYTYLIIDKSPTFILIVSITMKQQSSFSMSDVNFYQYQPSCVSRYICRQPDENTNREQLLNTSTLNWFSSMLHHRPTLNYALWD